MAEVYDNVPGVPGFVSHTLPNGSTKVSRAGQLERVIALHEDVQREVIKRGMQVFQRAQFRMNAVQARHVMRLKEDLAKAIKTGDPQLIADAQAELDSYFVNRTQVDWSQADVDFHVHLYRPDGKEFYVEAGRSGGKGDDGLRILRESLTH